ncbi:MAG: hypothetical protein ACO1QB_18130 [Verrucomicrobiales bacterium]
MDNQGTPIEGYVVYIFAFDIAYEFDDRPILTLLGQPVKQFNIDRTHRTPRHTNHFRPLMVELPLEKRSIYGRQKTIERNVKLLPIGAISISIKVPFEVRSIDELVEYHDLKYGDASVYEEVRNLAEQLRAELAPYMVRPMEALAEEEAYTVFCIESSSLFHEGATSAEEWLYDNRRQVASLLTQETDFESLSDQEAYESTSKALSYYETDLAVIDWDAALLVDEPADFDEALYLMELANLHLTELEAYDRLLDAALERSYRDLRSRAWRRRSDILFKLREIRIDLARYNDELSNITKFFGDWHLARLYEALSSRFHLPDWHKSVGEKLKTLDNLYQLLHHDQSNRWMLILEFTIVLLFIIDLVIIAIGIGK